MEVETGNVVHTLRPAQPFVDYAVKGVLPAAISPDRTEVAVGSEATDAGPAAIEVFTLATGRSRHLVVDDVPYIGMPLRWSPDGDRIAAATPDRVLVVDAQSGERLEALAVPEIDGIGGLAFDAGGRLVVTDLGGTTIVFDETGEQLALYGDPDEPQNGTWAPDGNLVLTNPFTGSRHRSSTPETGEAVAPPSPPARRSWPLSARTESALRSPGATSSRCGMSRPADRSANHSTRATATVTSSLIDASGTYLVSGGNRARSSGTSIPRCGGCGPAKRPVAT